jgi:5-methyltetrahydropteroyltriglutamate--homocysteine methyltransferase
VVLGLVTTKKPRLESIDVLKQKILDASRYVKLDRLGIGPQCGFASSILGNQISSDDQRRKLELVVKTSRTVWG